jgi:hypothetical protein
MLLVSEFILYLTKVSKIRKILALFLQKPSLSFFFKQNKKTLLYWIATASYNAGDDLTVNLLALSV